VAFVAIHGTGTPLGDPIEVNALSQPLAGRAGQTRPLAMLSNKACYGHTEGTAGITGLLLALQVHDRLAWHQGVQVLVSVGVTWCLAWARNGM